VAWTGGELLEHQEPAGSDLPDGGGHDQGEDAGGDPEDIQHQERLHAGGGGRGAEREPVGVRVGRGWRAFEVVVLLRRIAGANIRLAVFWDVEVWGV
jgi:hypothetical protein